MTTISRTSTTLTKGNDGRGARRRRIVKQRIAVAILSCCTTLLCMALFWEPSDDVTGAAARQFRASLRRRMEDIQSRVARKAAASLGGSAASAMRRLSSRMQYSPDLRNILEGHYTLVDLQVSHNAVVLEDGSYQSIMGHFCAVNWQVHKDDPSATPMYRDVVHASSCEDPIVMDLQTVMEAVSAFDQEHGVDDPNNNNGIHLMDLRGVVFHESRCGSTLVANVLQAMYPAEHRVYSESSPPIMALRLADTLGVEAATTVLKDVVYLMSRSNDPREQRVFFKIQSIGTTYMHVFLQAFPEVNFLFVYRLPEEVSDVM